MHTPHVVSGGRYPVLRALVIMSVRAAVGGFVIVVSLLAVAELLKLFIDIEHNTRMPMPGRIGVSMSLPSGEAATATVGADSNNGGVAAPGNRITALDEETAEAAL